MALPGDIYGDPYAPRPRRSRTPKEYLPQEEQESLLAQLARQSGSFVESLGLALDTPGAIARGILAGEPLSGFNWDSDKRVSGEELLSAYGIDSYSGNKSLDSYLSVPIGLATEIVTDPLFAIGGPLKAYSKAGKIAERAGLINLASQAAQNKLGTLAARNTRTGKGTVEAFKRAGLKETAGNLSARPYIGPRLAQNTATLSDVIAAAPDTAKARADVDAAIKALGGTFNEVANQKLGGAFGLGMFDQTAVQVPGAEGFLDMLDSAGNAIQWSTPARYLSAAFDKRIGTNNLDMASQVGAIRRSALEENLISGRRGLASKHLQIINDVKLNPQAKQLLGADSLNSREGNDFLTRLSETKSTANDKLILRAAPELLKYRRSWGQLRRLIGEERKALGIAGNIMKKDKFGGRFSPRYGDEFDLGPQTRSGSGKAEFSTTTPEAMGRRSEYMTPGGTVDMRELSELPDIRKHAMLGTASTLSEDNVADRVKDYFTSKYGSQMVSDADASQIARLMGRMNKDLPGNVPAFAAHPANAQARAIINSAKSRANAEFIYQSLGEAAEQVDAGSIAGAGYRKADNALNMVAKATGLKTHKGKAQPRVAQLLQESIAKQYNIADPTTINLAKYAISEDTVNRLIKVQGFYESPEVQKQVLSLFDKYTRVFKGFVLAFPSRFVRDSYSNLYSNWVVVGDANLVINSTAEASNILAGKMDKVLPSLASIPRYSGKSLDEVKQLFLQESGGSGVLSGLSTSDLLKSAVEGEYSQLVPGSRPVSISAGLKNLIPDGSRSLSQQVGDFANIQGVTNNYTTRNALLQSSNQIGDAIDSMHRLGGYIALLKKGYSPEQAAKEIKRALVDYSSLTSVEQNLFKALFPWWSFTSRTGKFVAEELATKPGGRFAQTLRGLNVTQRSDDDQYVPAALRSQFALRVPDEFRPYMGLPKSDATTFLTDVDIPGVDILNLIRTTGGTPSLLGTVQSVFGQANPLIRSAAELASGTDFFTGRPLGQSVTRADRIYQGLTGRTDTLNPILKATINNLPLPLRAVNTIGGLMDTRVPLQQRLVREGVNAFSGVKLRDVDPEWQLQDAKRQVDANLGEFTRNSVQSFIPESLLPYISPEQLAQFNLGKELDRDIKGIKSQKKAQGAGL